MGRFRNRLASFTLALLLGIGVGGALQGLSAAARPLLSSPLGTAFTYQGLVKQNGQPVNGTCDFQFSLFDADTGGAQLGSTQTVNNVAVTNGLFTVQLNGAGQFGPNAFAGGASFLRIAPSCPSSGSPNFVVLTPLQPVTAAPNALFSLATSGLRNVPLAATAPTDGQELLFSQSQNQWVPSASVHGAHEFLTSGLLTVPAGVTTLLVEAWGGGGGAGANGASSGGGGGGGGAGAYAQTALTVTPGAILTVTIGAGGAAGASGGNTVITPSGGPALLTVNGGGAGGNGGPNCPGGAGGTAGAGAAAPTGVMIARAGQNGTAGSASFSLPGAPCTQGTAGFGGAGTSGSLTPPQSATGGLQAPGSGGAQLTGGSRDGYVVVRW